MKDQSKRELVLTRIFDAPRKLVFKAWTDQEMIAKWWGPKGVSNPVCNIDAKQNGLLDIVMEAGEELGSLKGTKWPMKGQFQEIREPERIVFTSTAMIDNKPILENRNTVTFEEYEGKTKMTLHIIVTKATPEAEGPLSGMKIGWSQSLDKLQELLRDSNSK